MGSLAGLYILCAFDVLGMGKELVVVHFFSPSVSWTDFLNKDLWSWKWWFCKVRTVLHLWK
jgi:hypothetical protein